MSQEETGFWDSSAGKAIGVIGGLVILVAVVWFFWPVNPAAQANKRIFIDATTGKPFNVTLSDGMPIPCKAPSGGMTGYPAELCYWTRDGKPKKDPTPVLLKIATDPSAGPTFCPDCGRLVVPHNPNPESAREAPPTEEEYKARHGGR